MEWLTFLFDKTVIVITVAATVVMAFATVRLGKLTKVLADETTRLADATSRPHVVATIALNSWYITQSEIRVENTGTATAYDIRVEFDPPIPPEERKPDRPTPLQRVSVLKPGQWISSHLSASKPLLEMAFAVEVSWRRDPKSTTRETHTYALDMKDYEGFTRFGAAEPLLQIAQEIRFMRDDWSEVLRGWKRLKVDVFNSIDRDDETTPDWEPEPEK